MNKKKNKEIRSNDENENKAICGLYGHMWEVTREMSAFYMQWLLCWMGARDPFSLSLKLKFYVKTNGNAHRVSIIEASVSILKRYVCH